jgi:hypothetical protein
MAQKWCSVSPTFALKFYCTFLVTVFTPSAIFGTILPNAVAIESFKNYLRKSCPALVPKFLRILTKVGTGKSN